MTSESEEADTDSAPEIDRAALIYEFGPRLGQIMTMADLGRGLTHQLSDKVVGIVGQGELNALAVQCREISRTAGLLLDMVVGKIEL